MMKQQYYVNDNAQPLSGDHEVHTASCIYIDLIKSKTYLGMYDNCADAVREAKKYYTQSNGCSFCAKPCHTG